MKRHFLVLIIILSSFQINIFSNLKVYASSLLVKAYQESANKIQKLYLLGPGDELEIIIEDAEESSGKYKILNDGSIFIPIIGKVNLNYNA